MFLRLAYFCPYQAVFNKNLTLDFICDLIKKKFDVNAST